MQQTTHNVPLYHYYLTQHLTPANRDKIMQVIKVYPADETGKFKQLVLFLIAIGDSNVVNLLEKINVHDPELDWYMSILLEFKLCRLNDRWLYRLLRASICCRNLSMLKRIHANSTHNKTFWSDTTNVNVLLMKAIHDENLDATLYLIHHVGFAQSHLQFVDLINKIDRPDLFDLVFDNEFNEDVNIQKCIFSNACYLNNITFIRKLLGHGTYFEVDSIHINSDSLISREIADYKKFDSPRTQV
jgi:hypothetical protein